MELGHSAMLADCVSILARRQETSLTPSRLRQADSQDGLQGFSRRLQPATERFRSSITMIHTLPYYIYTFSSRNKFAYTTIYTPWIIFCFLRSNTRGVNEKQALSISFRGTHGGEGKKPTWLAASFLAERRFPFFFSPMAFTTNPLQVFFLLFSFHLPLTSAFSHRNRERPPSHRSLRLIRGALFPVTCMRRYHPALSEACLLFFWGGGGGGRGGHPVG